MADESRLIVLGRISGLYGVRGWVRIFSDTDPRENILRYSPWLLDGTPYEVAEGKRHGKGLVARVRGFEDRDQAAGLIGKNIAVRRDQLPPPRADEFYWADLEGLAVVTTEGTDMGRVSHLFETGANDVLVVAGDRERLIPFVWGDVVKDVDFAQALIRVDWDPDF
ncbi:MAG: ribosome maturation factor RimM [Thiohalocapsa sp.]|nr:ribosome maturation factor RimM [Thiohalocapsa sp.]MCF7990971.1 ribosome maturation factor RimM [Thiohalocapsa sp.]